MRKLTAIMLTTFLISCKTKIICEQVKFNTIKPLVLCDISFQFDECFCRCFDLNNFSKVDEKLCSWKYGAFKEAAYPLHFCEGLSGFSIEDMALEVKPKIKNLSRLKSDYCN